MTKPYIIGCDEVGYGSLAGPLVIGAVRAPKDWSISGLNDSKKLTDKQRREMNMKLWGCGERGEIYYTIAKRSNEHIDKFGVAVSLRECYKEVAHMTYKTDSLIIIDGNLNFDETLSGMDYQTVVKADSQYPTVMAASILAKVYRDDIMIKLSDQYSQYMFSKNKGYGSPEHIAAIKKYGLTDIHRKSYKLK